MGAEPGAASERTESAVDTDIRVARFSGVPSLPAFEAANYRLGLAMEATDPDEILDRPDDPGRLRGAERSRLLAA